MNGEPAQDGTATGRLASLTLVRSTSVTGSMTLLSRLTGLARDIVIGRLFGAGPLVDAFIFAFKLPIGFAPLLMAVAIMLLEIFVSFLQAFIFTLLTAVFIGLMRVEAHH